ncbi:MAG: MFS transporter [Desulfobacterales bacterium]|nr:MFS transporter [Desulfobacterales bacterium]
MDSSIVNIALPVIMKDLKVPLSTIEWVVMTYLLTVSSLLLPFGRLSDIKGRRWIFCRGFIVFVAGSLFCAIAPDAVFLIIFRACQGIGAAMIMACSPALIVDVFPVEERGKALGMIGTVVATGLTAGPALGGLLLELFSWRMIFYINIPIGIITTIIAARILEGVDKKTLASETFDWQGSVLMVICFTSFILALSHLLDWGIFSTPVITLIAGTIISAVLLARIEQRKTSPIFDPELLHIRMFIFPVIGALILFASLFIIVFLMPFYLMYPAGFSMGKTGVTMIIPFLFMFFVSPFAGAAYDRVGSRIICTAGFFILAVSLYSFTCISSTPDFLTVAWRLALSGIGISLFVSPNSAAAMSAVSPHRRGIAAGTVAMARNFGMVIGIAIAGLIFNNSFYQLSSGLTLKVYQPELAPVFMASFNNVMSAGMIIALTGMVVSFLRGEEIKKQM